MVSCAIVCQLIQTTPDQGWHLVKMWVEPIFAVKLYVLFALASIVMVLVQILRSWILAPPFRPILPESARHAAVLFNRQARSLRRWMVLNILAWAVVTLAGALNLLGGISVQRTVGLPVIAFGLEDLLEPSVLFLLVLMALYVARWHILWRAERLERPQHVAEDQFSARISG